MSKPYEVLLVEDNENHQLILEYELGKIDLDINITTLFLKEDYVNYLSNETVDLIISDYHLPGFSGIQALLIKKKITPEIPFILVSGLLGEDFAVEAMISGAADYIMKDNLLRLNPAVKRELINYRTQKVQESKLVESANQYESLVQTIDGMVWEAYTQPLELTFVSPQAKDIIGISSQSLLQEQSYWLSYVHDNDLESVKAFYDKASSSIGEYHLEFRLVSESKNITWVKDSVQTVRINEKLIMKGLMINISAQKEREYKLNQTLTEKNSLLSEVHHRVKNNMAVISGMIQLQYLNENNPVIKEKLYASVGRIKTMALIHELLYTTNSFNKLNVGEHIQDLIKLTTGTDSSSDITVSVNSNQIMLDINEAVPFFLITHEVIENTFKQLESVNINTDINVNIYHTDLHNVLLQIQFIPSEEYQESMWFTENEEKTHLGLSLVKELSKQLEATYTFKNYDNQQQFELSFIRKETSRGSSGNPLFL